MQNNKILFIDRDGTLITEPADEQIDNLEKLQFEAGVIPALLALQKGGYQLVMISNQDGLGTRAFPEENFQLVHDAMMLLFTSQGVKFKEVLICPHFEEDNCDCRKPKIALVTEYLSAIDRENSFVIGDRTSDLQLARNMGITGIQYSNENGWDAIASQLLRSKRSAIINRKTNETDIVVDIDLDKNADAKISTGLSFFDHMLEQLAKHAGIALEIKAQGDLHIDEHHTVEDTAIALGSALTKALGDKRGIQRYGFLLPMDECLAQVAIDLSGRFYFEFEAEFKREKVGDLPTELVSHFFRSFAENCGATLHMEVRGENTHHMIESLFKALGRALRMALKIQDSNLPTTKGVL